MNDLMKEFVGFEGDFKPDEDWNHLMMVVRKIENLPPGFNWFTISPSQCTLTIERRNVDGSRIRKENGSYVDHITISKTASKGGDRRLKATYDVCSEFLKPKEKEDVDLVAYLKEVERCLRDLRAAKHADEYDRRLAAAAANWMKGPVSEWLNKNKDVKVFPVEPFRLKELIVYVEFTDLIGFSTAANKVLPELISNPEERAWDVMQRLDLMQNNDENEIEKIIKEVLNENILKVEEYRKGKKGLLGMFVGEVLKKGNGKLSPKTVNESLKKMLDE